MSFKYVRSPSNHSPLHNVIVEDERDLYLRAYDLVYEQINGSPFKPPSHEHIPIHVDLIQNHRHIKVKEIHSQLQ